MKKYRVVDVGQVTPDEWSRINPVAKGLMQEIVSLWSEVVEMEVIPMFHVCFEVRWDGRVSHIHLSYPAPSLAAGLAQIQEKAA